MKPLVIIPARGGSKGIPKKNIRLFNGKPLIYYTIEAARELFEDSHICVSTDDDEIMNCVQEIDLPVPFLRPTYLATDTSGTYEVLIHAISYYEKKGFYPDVVILLQPTSPLRNATHIRDALKIFTSDLDMVVSVRESKSNPYSVFIEAENELLTKFLPSNFTRRQDLSKVLEFNGAIYIINVSVLKKKPISEFTVMKKYLMDFASSIDIDDELDWSLAEMFSQKRKLD